jgi:putative Mg2+ transporter-C (MgtC) family protein
MLSAATSLSADHVALRLLAAAVLGGAIGFERELRERGAGLRTHTVVCVGSALFTLVSAYGFEGSRTDPTRIAAQIVSGIGFLGAGAIIRQGLSERGLTTAATLWLVAAIGMAAGAGWYSAAAIATGGALVTLGPLRVIAYRGMRRIRPEMERLLVDIPAGGSPAPVIEALERYGRVVSLDVEQEGDRRALAIDVALRGSEDEAQVVAAVAELEGVLGVRWMDS